MGSTESQDDSEAVEYEDGYAIMSDEEDLERLVTKDHRVLTQVHLEILEKVDNGCLKGTDRKGPERKKFSHDHKDLTTQESRGRRTLLHKMVDQPEKFSQREELVELLLDMKPHFLEVTDHHEETALFKAIALSNWGIASFFCEKSTDLPALLRITCAANKDTCLHAAIRACTQEFPAEGENVAEEREAGFNFVKYLIDKADRETLGVRGKDGNTPLHTAVEYERCIPGQSEIVELLVRKCEAAMDEVNDSSLSPYQHHLKTKESSAKSRSTRTGIGALENPSNCAPTTVPQNIATKTVKSVVSKKARNMAYENNERDEHKKMLILQKQKEEARARMYEADSIRDFLRLYYMRRSHTTLGNLEKQKDRSDTLRYLYGGD